MKYAYMLFILLVVMSCSKDEEGVPKDPITNGPDTTKVPEEPTPFDINQISDTYGEIADPSLYAKWGSYNVHDPSVIKEGDFFYSYSTDVAYGGSIRPGLQVRRSRDLVEWEFRGWVFPVLPFKGVEFIRSNGGEPFDALWAPYVIKTGGEFRLYYSLSSPTPRLSVIGLATATSPEGPWTEKELVVTSLDNAAIQTNAIDPTVLIDKSGNHWFYYGSAWDGIYIIKLDATTGLPAKVGDKGVRIAQRGFTGNQINGNIEAPEIIYNEGFDKYYLFLSYDWLETKYNVRVGRADNPEGPFLDFNGNNMNDETDNIPMILAPYRFENHQGWQGTAHCSVFQKEGQYFMAHQGRPGENFYFMDMHVRQMFWTEDGWPAVSPERFANVEDTPITKGEIPGTWERIFFHYGVVPGFSAEQISADMQRSATITLDEDGTVNGKSVNTWEYAEPKLTLRWEDGTIEEVFVHRGRDWENKIASTLLFTGLNQNGTAVWGKKK